MRDIKFRAWSKELKKIFSNCDVNHKGEVTFAWNPQEEDSTKLKECAGTKYEADCIPMQYTGLHDKNGKEIYEGDIVKFSPLYGTYSIMQGIPYSNESHITEIIYKGMGFKLKDMPDFMEIDWKDVEVIGNVYENSELLSKTNERRNERR